MIVLYAAAACSQAAQAELIAVDWQAAGDRLLVRDTATGLEWLRVSHTLGQSYDAVTARLHGGDLDGFSFASVIQVDALFADAKSNAHDGIKNLVNLWGPGQNWSWGLVGVSAITQTVHPDWPHVQWLAEIAYQTDPVANPDTPSFANAMNGSIEHAFASRRVGSALLRVSAVPEPVTWLQLLLGLGTVGMLLHRRPADAAQ
ncbi:MAG: hypothetical protein ACT6S0_06565 [Roseateles sp.]|uniref:hypothetical protein n=1 Tax=Roseateles sp. TaxID=1971397 RepID=UPI00403576B0